MNTKTYTVLMTTENANGVIHHPAQIGLTEERVEILRAQKRAASHLFPGGTDTIKVIAEN